MQAMTDPSTSLDTARPPRTGGPDVFLMGVSKAASTWIHRCLLEHPDVFVTESDSLRFFDMRYQEGIAGYEALFAGARTGQLKVDPSPTYFRSPVAAQRIAHHYPDSRFLLSLRNPVDRAFSQFWHEKKHARLDYSFEEALAHPMLFPWIVEHGFYAAHLENLLRYFSRDRVTIVLYDELVASPHDFLKHVLEGLQVSTDFKPTVLTKRVNESGVRENVGMRAVGRLRTMKWWAPVRRGLKSGLGIENPYRQFGRVISNRDEYERGISPEARQTLSSIYSDDLDRLRSMTGLSYEDW